MIFSENRCTLFGIMLLRQPVRRRRSGRADAGGVWPAADRHALRGILTASRRSHPDRRSRHAPPATLLRSREARRARRGRAARAPPSPVRRGLGHPRLRAEPSLSAGDDYRARRRRRRSWRPRALFIRVACAWFGRRTAQGACRCCRTNRSSSSTATRSPTWICTRSPRTIARPARSSPSPSFPTTAPTATAA